MMYRKRAFVKDGDLFVFVEDHKLAFFFFVSGSEVSSSPAAALTDFIPTGPICAGGGPIPGGGNMPGIIGPPCGSAPGLLPIVPG